MCVMNAQHFQFRYESQICHTSPIFGGGVGHRRFRSDFRVKNTTERIGGVLEKNHSFAMDVMQQNSAVTLLRKKTFAARDGEREGKMTEGNVKKNTSLCHVVLYVLYSVTPCRY